jgi:predicted dehydrogenase
MKSRTLIFSLPSRDAYNNDLKVGVIGLGFMGAAHVAAIAAYPDAELAAVVSRNAKGREGDFSEAGGNLSLERVQFDFARVRKYTEWQEMVADGEIEAISICLPTPFHSDVSVAALSAGKHVLCEKPMALTGPECDRMMAAALQSRRILMIGHVLRFWPAYRELHAFVNGRRYGRVRQASFLRTCGLPDWSSWLPDESQSGGAVMDLLVHDIDQILSLFGMPDRVTAKRLGDGDALMASFIYPGGPEVRLQGGWFAPGAPFHMSFQVRAEAAEIQLTPNGVQLSDLSGNRSAVKLEEANAYHAEMSYFLDRCRDGLQPSLCPPIESAKAVRVALNLKESRAKDGEQIKCLA